MELHYDITQEDYIAFNLHYFEHNAPLKRQIFFTQIFCVLICILGGTAIMYAIKKLSLISVLVYVVLAIAVFFWIPYSLKSKTIKNVKKILQQATNKELCGPKQFQLDSNGIRLTGRAEDTHYPFSRVCKVEEGKAHIYVFVDELSALIIPCTAFSNDTEKQAFLIELKQRIAVAKTSKEHS